MVREMGPMGLARSSGQILYDLAMADIDIFVGSRERFGALIYSYLIEKDEPTENLFRIVASIFDGTLVRDNPLTFCASVGRIATVELLGSGKLCANKESTDQG